MAIISADEWKKRQNIPSSRPATPTSGGIISAEEWLKTRPKEEKEKQKKVAQAAKKEPTKPSTPRVEIEKPRITPRNIGSFFGSGIIENLFLEPVGMAEDFLRLFPAAGFEASRAIAVAAGVGKKAQMPNPFAPGLEKAGPGRIVEEVGRRAAGAASAATLAKFPTGIGALKSVLPAAGIGAGYTAAQPGTSPADIGVSGAISAPFGPAGIFATRGLSAILRTLRPVPTAIAANIPKALVEKATALEKQVPKQLPARGQTTRQTGAVIEVPPGGFTAFQPKGTVLQRDPVSGVSVGTEETFGITLMKSLLGKDKFKKIQKQVREETVPDPSPDIIRIGKKPFGLRPPPVRKEFSREIPKVVSETKTFKITDPVVASADDVLNNVNKIKEEIKPFATRERIPGEQFEFATVTAKSPILSKFFDSMKERMRATSLSGRRLSLSMDRTEALARTRRGETVPLRNQINKLFARLSTSEKIQFYADREAGGLSQNTKFIQLNSLLTQYFGKRQAQANQFGILIDDFTHGPVGDPIIYLPHRLNEVGNKVFKADNANKFFDKVAKKNGITPAEARVIYSRFVSRKEPIQPFERERKLLIPDEWLEKNIPELVAQYEDQFSRRVAGAEVFGKDFKAAYDLAGKVGEETAEQFKTDLATDLIDDLVGLKNKDIVAGRQMDDLIQNAVRSKLSILTASKNVFQGLNALNSSFGPAASLNGLQKAFTKEGRTWARDVGVAAGEGFYQNTPQGKLFKIQDFLWRKTSGFPMTEDLNFVQAAVGSKDALKAIARALIKNPTSTPLKNRLELWGIDANTVIRTGGIPEKELRIASANYAIKSIFPKVAGTMPEWANIPVVGRATYLFLHYVFNQGRFIQENFKLGKWEGTKALARIAVSAAVTGEVALSAEAALFGKERPENIFARIMENQAAIIATIPYTLITGAGYLGGGFANLGGPVVSGASRTGLEFFSKAGKGDFPGAAGAIGKGFLRGDIPPIGPIPPTIPQGALIERVLRDQGKSEPGEDETQKRLREIYSTPTGDKSDLQKQLDQIYR